MSGTATPRDIEDVCPEVRHRQLQAAAQAAAGLGQLPKPLHHVIVVVGKIKPGHLGSARLCEVLLYASEAPALRAIARIGGDMERAEPTPLRRLGSLPEPDARDLCDVWEAAPWEPEIRADMAAPPPTATQDQPGHQAPRSARAPPADASTVDAELASAALRSPRGIWTQWVEIERSRLELKSELTVTRPAAVPPLGNLRRSSSFTERGGRSGAAKRQQLAARVASAPWNSGGALTWRAVSPRFDVSPGRQRPDTWRGSPTDPLLPGRSMPSPRAPQHASQAPPQRATAPKRASPKRGPPRRGAMMEQL